MILEIMLFVCLLIGFVAARSIQIADRSLGGRYYIIFPSSKILSWFAAILMFLGMISLFAIIIWGFIYIKWYIVVGSFIFCVYFSTDYGIGRKFPLSDITHLVLLFIFILLNVGLWIYKIFY